MFDKLWWKKARARQDALAEIREAQSGFEQMIKRAEATGTHLTVSLKDIPGRLEKIEMEATQASGDKLDDLVEQAKSLAQLRAYLCPPSEILAEGRSLIAMMKEWGVPDAIVAKLHTELVLKLAASDSTAGQGALRAVFDEFDSWDYYVDDYYSTMKRSAYVLSAAIAILLPVAIFLLHFPEGVHYGLIVASVAGGCVSVIARMPPLTVSSEFEAYRRHIVSRIATGVVASMIGCGLLAWGLVPISIQDQTFSDLLNACAAKADTSCTGEKILILVGIPMLFSFSERALMSFEERIFGNSRGQAQKAQE